MKVLINCLAYYRQSDWLKNFIIMREGGGGGNLSKLPNKVKGQLASKQIYTEKKG
jgi:hypothetical protein